MDKVKLVKHVAYRILDNEAVVINTKESTVVVLNEVGSIILKLIDEEKSVRDILQCIADEFQEVPSLDEIRNEVNSFIHLLKENRILEEAH